MEIHWNWIQMTFTQVRTRGKYTIFTLKSMTGVDFLDGFVHSKIKKQRVESVDNFWCKIIKLPVVGERQHLLDKGDNANVNNRRPFCDFSMLHEIRKRLDAASLRYAKNFQLVVIEMLNYKSRHRFHCDLAPPNVYKKRSCIKSLAIRWASLHGQ